MMFYSIACNQTAGAGGNLIQVGAFTFTIPFPNVYLVSVSIICLHGIAAGGNQIVPCSFYINASGKSISDSLVNFVDTSSGAGFAFEKTTELEIPVSSGQGNQQNWTGLKLPAGNYSVALTAYISHAINDTFDTTLLMVMEQR